MILPPEYIGDGAYCSFDGFHVVLTTGHNDPAKADNVVCLEPEVLRSFEGYVARLRAAIKTEHPDFKL